MQHDSFILGSLIILPTQTNTLTYPELCMQRSTMYNCIRDCFTNVDYLPKGVCTETGGVCRQALAGSAGSGGSGSKQVCVQEVAS